MKLNEEKKEGHVMENIYINNIENDEEGQRESADRPLILDGADDEDLPKSLIVTNVDVKVFSSEKDKEMFELMFKQFDEEATFQYFKSFRRARVNFTTTTAAANTRIELHQAQVGDGIINCYFAQPTSPKEETNDAFLQPPTPVKQFLISPPASPPVGWEPVGEAEPIINYDLLTAIANLSSGESHELHPPSDNQPGIVVHICEEPEGGNTTNTNTNNTIANSKKPKIIPTRCPDK